MTNRHLALAAASAISVAATPAWATGVSAGAQINNTATATFDDGPTTVSVQSNTVSLRVDELLDVTLTSLAGGTTTLASNVTAVPFRVANTGNGIEAFALALTATNGGNQFDAVVQGIAVDSNGNGIYDAGVDQIIGSGGTTGDLAADGGITVFALVTLPNGVADGATSQLRLVATAITGSGAPGTIYPGAGANGSDAVVGSSTASASVTASLVAGAFTVNLVKSATISDPFGTTQPVPGAVVTYAIAANVVGSGTATNLRITDSIPAGTTYRPGSLTLEGAPISDAADNDAGTASSSGIAVAIGSVAGGASRTVTFQVTID